MAKPDIKQLLANIKAGDHNMVPIYHCFHYIKKGWMTVDDEDYLQLQAYHTELYAYKNKLYYDSLWFDRQYEDEPW